MRRTEQNIGDLLTVAELGEWLHLTRRAIYTAVNLKKIPGVVKLGRRLRFRREAIEAWIESGRARS